MSSKHLCVNILFTTALTKNQQNWHLLISDSNKVSKIIIFYIEFACLMFYYYFEDFANDILSKVVWCDTCILAFVVYQCLSIYPPPLPNHYFMYTLSHHENDRDVTERAQGYTRCKTHPLCVNLGVPF